MTELVSGAREFRKILIANRGEIAVRVARTARALGFRTVAVYSDADRDSLHVECCDEAVHIGPPPTPQSYLNIERILSAAKKTGVDAIHPGYGFLSENAQFAEAVADVGLVFIGPPVTAIRLMGSKRLSKIAMLQAGVPCIPGYEGAAQDDATLVREAERIGLPLMVKASAGGGGRGMRLVTQRQELDDALRSARSEATNAFGSGELILERAVLRPRHIEIQVFADQHGNCIHLGERDCSIQRRHQKVVEEAPSPFCTPELRARMGSAAVAAAKSCGYVGAGTVEFLVNAERDFFFLEMNTRLQVEHPVTELVHGIDLVAWQIRVAAGEPLPLTQEEVVLRGHAIEVRLYAEDSRRNFLPQTGVVERLNWPQGLGVRVDAGVRERQTVGAFYDPMLAKLIVHADDRRTAARRLAIALEDLILFGVTTNRSFLAEIVRHPEFLAGTATTAFIAEHMAEARSMAPLTLSADWLALGSLLLFCGGRPPFAGWRGVQLSTTRLELRDANDVRHVALLHWPAPNQATVTLAGVSFELHLLALDADEVRYECGGVRRQLAYRRSGDFVEINAGADGNYRFEDVTLAPPSVAMDEETGQLVAQMDGAVIAIFREPGSRVNAGEAVLAIEAMKMETRLLAPFDAIVDKVLVKLGQQVKGRQILVSLARIAAT